MPDQRAYILARVRFEPAPPNTPGGPCWIWTRSRNADGYGNVGSSRMNPWRESLAHRLAWRIFRGDFPAGLEPDHLCRVRACCNPAHTEPVTHRENMRRSPYNAELMSRTKCPSGHPYEGRNLIQRGERRWCRACMNAAQRQRYYRLHQRPLPA